MWWRKKEERKKNNNKYSGHFIPQQRPKGSACTPLGPISSGVKGKII
jgi:hypothetical protein